ncbi:MAG: hypothetical protein OXC95_16180 [Dehalococcoidia bacterium]|nr:hypothetical protein [Dehalococcoidia bacterium]
MNVTKLFGFATVLMLMLAVSCNSATTAPEDEAHKTYEVVTTHTSEDGESTFEMYASTPVLSFDELGDMAELVILGKVASRNAIKKEREYFSDTYAKYLVILDVEVTEYLKGSGPDSIKVATYDIEKHPTSPKVEDGETYVLYLTVLKNEDDRAFYENAYYLGLAHQGIWKVDGETATHQMLNKTARLDELRKTASVGFQHPILDYENFLEKSHLLSHDLTLSTTELTTIASVVVRGSRSGEARAKDAPEYPSGYSQDKKTQDATLLEGVKVYEFKVSQYYAGTGPSIINIFTDGSDEYPFIEENADYILYLYEADFEAARAYYDNAYVIVGSGQGIWVVDDGKAVQSDGAKTVDLSELDND